MNGNPSCQINATPSPALTTNQQCLLDYVAQCLVTEHHWPTIRQIAADFGVANNAAGERMAALEKKGAICRNAQGKLMLARHGVAVHLFPPSA